jgi:anti-sigma B factor antagonist
MTSLVSSTPAPSDDADQADLLQVESTVHGDHATVTAAGEIDIATVTDLNRAVVDCVQSGAQRLIVDLDRVTYMDSAGLGAVVSAFKRLAAVGGSMTVRCTQPRILQLFEITGLHHFLTIVGTDDGMLETAG